MLRETGDCWLITTSTFSGFWPNKRGAATSSTASLSFKFHCRRTGEILFLTRQVPPPLPPVFRGSFHHVGRGYMQPATRPNAEVTHDGSRGARSSQVHVGRFEAHGAEQL